MAIQSQPACETNPLHPPDFELHQGQSMAGRQLTRYELEIMDVVWRLEEVTVHDVCANLSHRWPIPR